MTVHGGGRSGGMERVWRLTSAGFRIMDVDSDDLFVGIRLERNGESLTLLLTREDFEGIFPGAASGHAARRAAAAADAERNT